MTAILVAGAVVGLGLLLLVLVLAPPASQPGAALARLDAAREDRRLSAAVHDASRLARGLGRRTVGVLESTGLDLHRLRADLNLVGRSVEAHAATSLLAALGGIAVPIVVAAVLLVLGVGGIGGVPVIIAGLAGLLGAVVPSLVVRSRAADRRRDLRHVVGAFLDLVAMSLAGGRGVPEALQSASEVSDGWAMIRIREALSSARLRGVTPWAALGQLGEDVAVGELRDLAAALALVAEDGAKVRESLSARADSMRRRELAESEGRAGERSQSMLVAQLLLCIGFLIFLVYPAMVAVLESR